MLDPGLEGCSSPEQVGALHSTYIVRELRQLELAGDPRPCHHRGSSWVMLGGSLMTAQARLGTERQTRGVLGMADRGARAHRYRYIVCLYRHWQRPKSPDEDMMHFIPLCDDFVGHLSKHLDILIIQVF